MTDETRASSKRLGLWALSAAVVVALLYVLVLRDSTRKAVGPPIVVRDILVELVDHPERWNVTTERAESSPSKGVFAPLIDLDFTGVRYDTGDKPALIMPPPCEVSIDILESDGPCQLRSSAQISNTHTDRGIVSVEKYRRDSALDLIGLDSITIRFELLVNGAPVFDETITHAHGEEGKDREWSKIGDQGTLSVKPGDRITLRTSLPNEQQAETLEGVPIVCGFGGLTLESEKLVERQPVSSESPSLLFIVMDTLRADRLSCYGYEKKTTPNLDALASRGVLFENAHATSSWTWPSTASLHTGLLPYEHGVLANDSGTLIHARETLAEVLQSRGYTTQGISTNPLIDETRLFNQGFESFSSSRLMQKTDGVIDSIETALEQLADKRFFLYLHLVDPHTPHSPLPSELERLGGVAPEDYPDKTVIGIKVDGLDHYAGVLGQDASEGHGGRESVDRLIPAAHQQWLQDRYDASVGTSDVYLGRIFDKLSQLGLDDSTIVVFTSDHGEELLDHNGLAHGHALWKELTHVPLIIAGPDVPSGTRVSKIVSNRHIGPTLARFGGTQLKSCTDGLFLLDPSFPDQEVFSQTSKGYWNGHAHREVWGLHKGDTVLHHAPEAGPFGVVNPEGDSRLFDLSVDPNEQHNLLQQAPDHAWLPPMLQSLKLNHQLQTERRSGTATGVGESGWRLLQNVGYVGTDEEMKK